MGKRIRVRENNLYQRIKDLFPRIKPVADRRRFLWRESRWVGVGDVFLWELTWRGQEWYIYKGPYKKSPFPYRDVAEAVSVKQFGQYYIWKGTYKH
jgi:hypothetical protein